MPYAVNKAAALEKILAVAQEKKALFAGIGDIRDESDRTGMRAVIEVKRDGDPEKILQYLFKYSDLQTTFGVNIVAIAGGRPQQMGLKPLIAHYIRHQRDVVTRRTKYELEAAKKREHILSGLKIAVDNLDEVIRIIRKSKSPKEAREALMQRFGLSDVQAQAILDLRLQRLTNMELRLIEEEYAAVLQQIETLTAILASEKKLLDLIKKELVEIRDEIACPRRTQLIDAEGEIPVEEEALAFVEDATVVLCEDLKIRRCPTKQLNLSQISDDKPLFVLPTQTNQRIRIFTNLGAMLQINVSDIPETRPAARATNLAALLPFEKNERILLAEAGDTDSRDYLFYTKLGNVKRTPAGDYQLRVKRTAALSLRAGDEVIAVERFTAQSILLVTKKGMSIRFAGDTVPAMGRVSGGVKAIKLDSGDTVLYGAALPEEGEILTITDRGYGKRSLLLDYDLQGRNGKGLRTFDMKKNGSNGTCIAAVLYVGEPYDFSVVQRHGTITNLHTGMVHVEPRAGKGVMLVAVVLDDDVTAAYRK